MLFVELCDSPAPDGFRLILASNRDESYRRPTDRAHQWEEAPSVIGGEGIGLALGGLGLLEAARCDARRPVGWQPNGRRSECGRLAANRAFAPGAQCAE